MNKSEKPFYGYYGFGYFHLIISIDVILGILIILFFLKLGGIKILVRSF